MVSNGAVINELLRLGGLQKMATHLIFVMIEGNIKQTLCLQGSFLVAMKKTSIIRLYDGQSHEMESTVNGIVDVFISKLVGSLPPIWKTYQSNFDHFPNFLGEHNKIFETTA